MSASVLSASVPGSRGGVDRRSTRAFFFFQAEDGIRDLTVTGVQTCALPISRDRGVQRRRRGRRIRRRPVRREPAGRRGGRVREITAAIRDAGRAREQQNGRAAGRGKGENSGGGGLFKKKKKNNT